MIKYTTTSVKSCGLCLTFLFSIFTIPTTFADNQILGDNSQCDNTTLHTTTGSVTLNANWEENTIILDWQPGEGTNFTRPESNDNAYSCTYNGGITLPTTPTRSGYTFGGWRVYNRCELDGVVNTNGTHDYAHGYDYLYNNDSCYADGVATSDCGDLGMMEWKTTFGSGENLSVVRGIATCDATHSGTDPWEGANYVIREGNILNGNALTARIVDTSADCNIGECFVSEYCWCRMTEYTPSDGAACSVASPSWVFAYDVGIGEFCIDQCALYCANHVRYYDNFRRAIFGVSAE